MRIGVEIISLQNDSRHRGIGMYTRCLLKNILSIDRGNEYVFFTFGNWPLSSILNEEGFKGIRIIKINPPLKQSSWFFAQAFLPLAMKKEKLDIFHSTGYILPAFSKHKKIMTIYDLIYSEVYWKKSSILKKMYFYLKDQTLKRADKIITISEYSKKKIIELLGIEEDRIRVIYPAVESIYRPFNDSGIFSGLRKKYSIDRDFLLFVGALDFHKNIDSMVKALARVESKDIGLVLAGVNYRRMHRENIKIINNLVKKLKLEDRVYILGHIPQEDLIGFYNMAKIVISVSYYEGFGLPILEGMACAKPVIAAKNTSMKEIVGSSGILVDPYNIDEIACAVDNLLSDEELRNNLSKKAFERSKEFSWEKAARETVSLYQDLVR